jgi:hypothetical protein
LEQVGQQVLIPILILLPTAELLVSIGFKPLAVVLAARVMGLLQTSHILIRVGLVAVEVRTHLVVKLWYPELKEHRVKVFLEVQGIILAYQWHPEAAVELVKQAKVI